MGLFESYIKYLNENVGANHNFSEKYGDVYFLKKKIKTKKYFLNLKV